MGRRGGGGYAPSFRAAPPAEFENETVFDWIRRQNNPIKAMKQGLTQKDKTLEKKEGED